MCIHQWAIWSKNVFCYGWLYAENHDLSSIPVVRGWKLWWNRVTIMSHHESHHESHHPSHHPSHHQSHHESHHESHHWRLQLHSFRRYKNWDKGFGISKVKKDIVRGWILLSVLRGKMNILELITHEVASRTFTSERKANKVLRSDRQRTYIIWSDLMNDIHTFSLL